MSRDNSYLQRKASPCQHTTPRQPRKNKSGIKKMPDNGRRHVETHSTGSDSSGTSRSTLATSISSDTAPTCGVNLDNQLQLDSWTAGSKLWALATETHLLSLSYNCSIENPTYPTSTAFAKPCDKCQAFVFGAPTPCPEGGLHYTNMEPLRNLEGPATFSRDCVALDCEMVMTTLGRELAHLSVLDGYGSSIANWFVKPRGEIVDLCTQYSGIENQDCLLAEDALSFEDVPTALISIGVTSNTYLIGHGLENDLKAMRLLHTHIIDTAILFYDTYRQRRVRLAILADEHLGRQIQFRNHDPAEDARAALDLVKRFAALAPPQEDRLVSSAKLLGFLGRGRAQSPGRRRRLEARTCYRCHCRGHMAAQCTVLSPPAIEVRMTGEPRTRRKLS